MLLLIRNTEGQPAPNMDRLVHAYGAESSDSSETAVEQSSQAEESSTRIRHSKSTTQSIRHEYHDRSSLTFDSVDPPNTKRPTNLVLFPVKLFDMLNLVENDGLSHIISWQPHGRCFVIRKPQELKTVLLTYMPGITEIRSFERQV
jgi:HSF-type DNA-binding